MVTTTTTAAALLAMISAVMMPPSPQHMTRLRTVHDHRRPHRMSRERSYSGSPTRFMAVPDLMVLLPCIVCVLLMQCCPRTSAQDLWADDEVRSLTRLTYFYYNK
eukprot:6966746-Pyramimonas_sp.AAC.1